MPLAGIGEFAREHTFCSVRRRAAFRMAVHGAADISPESLDVSGDGRRPVVEDFVCAEALKISMVLRGGEGDDEGGGVVDTGLLDGVDAHICGGGVDEELFSSLHIRKLPSFRQWEVEGYLQCLRPSRDSAP